MRFRSNSPLRWRDRTAAASSALRGPTVRALPLLFAALWAACGFGVTGQAALSSPLAVHSPLPVASTRETAPLDAALAQLADLTANPDKTPTYGPADPETLAAAKAVVDFSLGKSTPAKGVYARFDLARPPAKIAEHLADPVFPLGLSKPALLRLGSFRDVFAAEPGFAAARGALFEGGPARFVRAVLSVQTTPDRSSGVWHQREPACLVVAGRIDGRDALLTATIPKTPLAPGRKGVAAGREGDYKFLYAKAAAPPEKDPGSPLDGFMIEVFSAAPGENVSKTGLIVMPASDLVWNQARMEATAALLVRDRKRLFDSPLLPSPTEIAGFRRSLALLPEASLRIQAKTPTAAATSTALNRDPAQADPDLAWILKGDEYVNSLNRSELEAEILKQFLLDKLNRDAKPGP